MKNLPSGANNGRDVVGCSSDELCSAIFFITKFDRAERVAIIYHDDGQHSGVVRWAD